MGKKKKKSTWPKVPGVDPSVRNRTSVVFDSTGRWHDPTPPLEEGDSWLHASGALIQRIDGKNVIVVPGWTIDKFRGLP